MKNLFETMINDYKRLQNGLKHDKRCGTVREDEGLWCYDGGRSVTMGHDDLKMVTGR